MEEKDENKTSICPNCKQPFTCNAQEIGNCECTNLVLSDKAKQYISTHFTDCLCINCLKAINEIFNNK